MSRKKNYKFSERRRTELTHVQVLEVEIRAIDMYIHNHIEEMSIKEYQNCVSRMRDLCSLMFHLIDEYDPNFLEMEGIIDACYTLLDNRITLDF